MQRVIFSLVFLILAVGPARAFFPFSWGKQELKTDYSQTVWDRIMLDQSVSDMRRGMGEMSSARYTDASNSFAKAIIKNPSDPLPHLLYGASLYWSGRVDDAMTEYREALRLDPSNAMGYQLLGIAWGWKGNIAQAQDNFLKAERLNPYKADTQMNLGSTYVAQKKFDRALDHYRRAVQLAPREALYHFQLGSLFDFMGRDAQAEASYKKALKFFYRYEDAQLALAALYEKRDNTKDALKYYKKAVKTKSGDFVARLRYGYLLMRLGQIKEAREVMEGAFSIVAFDDDGLALNAVYRASGQNGETFRKQIEKFKENLLQVPSAKDVQVEVSLNYNPVVSVQPPEQENNRFAEAYQTLYGAQNPLSAAQSAGTMSFQRSFVLNAATELERETQVKELVAELERAVNAAADKYDVSMTLQGRTMDYASPSALTQSRSAPPKAVYDPRIVGNDMGLWVMGKTWLRYVDEIEADLNERVLQTPSAEYYILQGLASLLAGNASAAVKAFEAARGLNASDALPLLGLGTAAVMAGDDSSAAAYYRLALEKDSKNKTARRNLKVLEEE